MLSFIPLYQLAIVAFFFGVIIGSFLNVYIYRFHTGKSLAGHSHCLSCRTPLRFYELFPLLSYLGLRGKCRTCGARIPSRYFWVELVTGVLFSTVVLFITNFYFWPLSFVLVAVLVVVSVYDLYHFVIPDEFVYILSVIALVRVAMQLYFTYRITMMFDWQLLAWSSLSGLLAFLFFWGLWAYSKGHWIGFGDAKLAVPLAFMIGISGVFSMLTLSFWIGTIISLVLISVQKVTTSGQLRLHFSPSALTIKSEVPFAPFMILGFLAVYLWQIDVLQLLNYALY